MEWNDVDIQGKGLATLDIGKEMDPLLLRQIRYRS
jgi:hypothetical protein